MRQARIFTPDNLLLIRQMAAEGKSSIEIAESIASTPASVRVVCCHHNIKLTRGRTPSNHATIVTRLPVSLFTEFRRKAEDLRIPASILARRLLAAIVVSNIYEAVLDDNN
jgi:hypothetical protein